jgi:hypothetical protein
LARLGRDLASIWLKITTALSEIVVGAIAQLIIRAALGHAVLGADQTSYARYTRVRVMGEKLRMLG